MKLSYIFMGSPALAATILDTLCRELYPPTLVVTQTAKATGRGQGIVPTAVETLAREKGLEVIATDDVNKLDLRAHAPDLILVAAFGQLLKENVLGAPELFCLNVHGSLLPKYRGASPIQMAIWNGEKTTGVTIQKMVRKLDAGDILLKKETSIGPSETSGELMDRLAVLGGQALVEAVRLVETGSHHFTPQDEAEATHARKLEKTDSILDWKRPALALHNQVRALQPWPVAEARLEGVRLRVFRTQVCEGEKGLEPGAISTDHKTFLRVQCGDGRALSLTAIQLENRKKLEIKDFLLAYRGSFPHRNMT